MLIAIHSTPGLGRVISRLQFPPDVIVFPRCETSTLADTIRIAIQRLKQLETFGQEKTVVCIDWFEAHEDASDIERQFIKVHAQTMSELTPHMCRQVFLDIEPSYAFELLIREGSTVQGTSLIERPDTCITSTTAARDGDGCLVVPVARHEFDTSLFRKRIVSQILGRN